MTYLLPDAELMFFDRLLAFDHLRHQIHIVAAADVAKEAPPKAYARALARYRRAGAETGARTEPALWRKPEQRKAGKLKSTPEPAAMGTCAWWSAAKSTLRQATFFKSYPRSAWISSRGAIPLIFTARCGR